MTVADEQQDCEAAEAETLARAAARQPRSSSHVGLRCLANRDRPRSLCAPLPRECQARASSLTRSIQTYACIGDLPLTRALPTKAFTPRLLPLYILPRRRPRTTSMRMPMALRQHKRTRRIAASSKMPSIR